MMEHKPLPEEKKGEERRQAPEPQPERAEPVNHDETETLSREKKKREETRQVTEPPPARRGTRNTMMKQNACPEERKKKEEGGQAPEPKKREYGRQAPEPHEEPANHDGTEPLSSGKERGEKKGDKHRNPREQRPFVARIEDPIEPKSCLGKKSNICFYNIKITISL